MYSDDNLIYKADDLRVGLFMPESTKKEVL